MPTSYPAIKGKFGSTEYWIVTMPASQLERQLRLPKEIEGWDNFTMEERFQREVNYKRAKEHIAPYLTTDPDRFFGAFIIAVLNPENMEFELLSDVVKSVPKSYQNVIPGFGILWLNGDEMFVPLDGQHRLTAIKFAITGKDEKGKDIPNFEPLTDVAKDDCTCMLIKFDTSKARKIFNKVNRYAKVTSKADNLITSDDDIVAVITRKIVHEFFDDRIVNLKNTLSKKSPEFTTLSTLYEATGLILESGTLGVGHKIDRTKLPDQSKQKVMHNAAEEFWKRFCSDINVLNAPLQDPAESGDKKRIEFRNDYVLGKPIIQVALVGAIARLSDTHDAGVNPDMDGIYNKINTCDWSTSNRLWQRVVLNGDKVITGSQARKFASRFIAYYLGEPLDDKELKILSEQYADLFDKSEQVTALPKPIS